MPIVPAPQKTPANIRQLSGVSGFTISADEMGARAWDALPAALNEISRNVTDGLSRGFGNAQRQQQRAGELLDAEAAEKAATEYLGFADQTLNGTVGDDGQAMGGLLSRTAGEARQVAAAWKRSESEWLNKPGGVYAVLTPGQRTVFESRIAAQAQRFAASAVGHELQQAEAQRKVDTEARAFTHKNLMQNSFDRADDEFLPVAQGYAEAEADREVAGGVRVESGGQRTFRSSEIAAAWQAKRDAVLDASRAERAANLAQRAALADLDDPGAAEMLARAKEQAGDETLSPAARLRAGDAVARAEQSRETRRSVAVAQAQAREREAKAATTDRLEKRFEESSKDGHADPAAAIRDLFAINEEAGDSANRDKADYLVERLRSLTARRAEANQEARDADVEARTVAVLDAGLVADAAGNTVYIAPQERDGLADSAYIAGDISEPQWKALKAAAARDQAPALQRFHRDAMAFILPDMAGVVRDPGVLAYDPDTQRYEVVRDKVNPLKFGPETRSGIRREYRNEQGKKRREDLLLSQIAEALDVFRGRIEADPRYGDRHALEDFKEFIRPAREEFARKTAAEYLAHEAAVLGKVRAKADATRAGILSQQ